MPELIQGRIVWATFADKRGHNNYQRPVIILSGTDDIPKHDSVIGVVASHSAALENPLPDWCVEIPHHPSGRICTKLKKPTVAVCDWSVVVTKSEIGEENIGGYVPPKILELVVDKYFKYHKNPH